MPHLNISARRRFLQQSVGGAILAPVLSGVLLGACQKAYAAPEHFHWQAEALGAPASIIIAKPTHNISGSDHECARITTTAFIECEKLVTRLEAVFSLYDPSSEISRLNRDGYLDDPSTKFVDLVQLSNKISVATEGAFDISVQPLWELSQKLLTIRAPQAVIDQMWAQARAKVGYQHIHATHSRIEFLKPNMAITLNGIAQGFITDKVCQYLDGEGFEDYLVNIGEYRAKGIKNPTISAPLFSDLWQIGIQDPSNVLALSAKISLKNMGLATSAAGGGHISEQLSHIFHAKDNTKPEFASASVLHPSAAIADGLATAFTVMTKNQIENCLRFFVGTRAILINDLGEIIEIRSP